MIKKHKNKRFSTIRHNHLSNAINMFLQLKNELTTYSQSHPLMFYQSLLIT